MLISNQTNMRKKVFQSLLLALVCGLSAVAEDNAVILPGYSLQLLPGSISRDGKDMLYSDLHDENANTYQFFVYDDDFSMVKSFVTLDPPVYFNGQFSQEREYVYTTVDSIELKHVNWDYTPLEISGVTTGLTIERVQGYVYALNGKGEIASLDNEYPVVALGFYEENKYGKEYPNEFYMESRGEWFLCTADYGNVTIYGPFGEWGQIDGYGYNKGRLVEIYLMPSDGSESECYELTRGIFSEDVNYIYPVCEEISYSREFESTEVPGLIYRKEWGASFKTIGYVVYDSSNNEVARIDLPKGYDGESYMTFIRLGEKRYIALDAENADGEWFNIIYRLDSNNNVSFVTAAPTSKVWPRNPRRGEKVNVTLDSAVVSDGAIVHVVSAAGQTLFNSKIPSGQTSLDINTSGFQQGMYVVTVSGNGITKEAAKIIVR